MITYQQVTTEGKYQLRVDSVFSALLVLRLETLMDFTNGISEKQLN